MISLKEIGKICGLAESTVSKALKQAPGIKKETAARVMEVARQYGYQPNAMVECIQTGRSRSIGIAFNKFQCEFAGGVMEGIHQVLHEHEYDSYLISWDRLVKDKVDLLSRFSRRRVDGLLLFPMAQPPTSAQIRDLNRFHNPIVLVDSERPDYNFDHVGADNSSSFPEIIKYLKTKNCRNIGILSFTQNSNGRLRRAAFLEAMAECNLPVNARFCIDLSDCWNEAYGAAKQLLANPQNRPDALLCFNDYAANDVLNAALDLGIRVPEELGIVGFGNLPLSERTRPQLTTVDQFPCEIGRTAAQLLLDRISGKETGGCKSITINTKFIKRRSTK